MEKITKRGTIPKDHANFEVCSKCNGRCCKSHPCHVFPEDFDKITVDTVIKKLQEGYCLDYWENVKKDDERTYWYIRPSVKGKQHLLVDATWGGECIFFENGKGCVLSERQRPSGGKALIPRKKPELECKEIEGYSKEDCYKLWLPYNDILEEAKKRLDNGSNIYNENTVDAIDILFKKLLL